MSFELLSEPIRHYIRDKRWDELRPIQNAAIAKILSTEENYILASRTASGKTEAAFLPILSKVDFTEVGVQVLYISPLKALINDQFNRVEELCKYLDVTVTKWHGDAKQSAKGHLIKDPKGIVLITPESLEAMFVNKPFNVKHLFSNLKFVVIDEIHSFIGTDRGIQLKSILSRLHRITLDPFRLIGLSATIGDYDEAKRFTGDATRTKVLLDKTPKEVEAEFRYFEETGSDLPAELVKDLYLETRDNKVLIFPNSRGRTEEVAVRLKKTSDRANGHANYFSHHSSVDKDVREYVEFFAKNNRRGNFAISCTSTLELGIDIGSVDEVVQIDATSSVSSLIQRVGRSGRQDGKKSSLFLYATNAWSLLQSLACWTLYQEGIIEPPETIGQPYDILLHQALSITKGHSGIGVNLLIDQLETNFAFHGIERSKIEEIIVHLIKTEMLEKLGYEVIIGLEGEKIVNSRDFYSVFKTEDNFKVLTGGRAVGEIPFSPQVAEGENILLAARIWKIQHIDFKAMRIEVTKALDGKKPSFSGGGANVHKSIRERMLSLLYSDDNFDVLNPASREEFEGMRKEFANFKIRDVEYERPLLLKERSVQFFTFTGTKINRAIKLFLGINQTGNKMDDRSSSFELEMSHDEFDSLWPKLVPSSDEIDEYITDLLLTNPALAAFSKWSSFLPVDLQVSLFKQRHYDLEGARIFLKTCRLCSAGEGKPLRITVAGLLD
ncbi:MAG TPA: DEAD/DEAH box helicase [Pyrinomonadaceae bacterium]|nr:DEAD/DEAH box helicase [Pyrinomonadaceae bacterium]